MKKKIPHFKDEKSEQVFWAEADSTEYLDWSKAIKNPVFANLKPTSTSISIRMPSYLIMRLKERGNRLNIPYQTLMKQYIAAGIAEK